MPLIGSQDICDMEFEGSYCFYPQSAWVAQARRSQACREGRPVYATLELGPTTLKELARITMALEMILTECRRFADSAHFAQPVLASPCGILPSEGLPGGVLLADQGRESERSKSPYLDAKEAAEYLGTTVKSLYGLVERRRMVPLRGPRRTYRFTKELLDDYLKREE